MAQLVCMGASLQCSFGMAPSTLISPPVVVAPPGGASIMDNIPIANIPPFGMCNSMSNPMVIAATAAALGVLTPMPCVPMTPAPWAPGSPTLLMGTFPALNNTSTLNCIWGGVIQIVNAGQATVQIP